MPIGVLSSYRNFITNMRIFAILALFYIWR